MHNMMLSVSMSERNNLDAYLPYLNNFFISLLTDTLFFDAHSLILTHIIIWVIVCLSVSLFHISSAICGHHAMVSRRIGVQLRVRLGTPLAVR